MESYRDVSVAVVRYPVWQRRGGGVGGVAGEAVPLGGFSYRQKGSGNLD